MKFQSFFKCRLICFVNELRCKHHLVTTINQLKLSTLSVSALKLTQERYHSYVQTPAQFDIRYLCLSHAIMSLFINKEPSKKFQISSRPRGPFYSTHFQFYASVTSIIINIYNQPYMLQYIHIHTHTHIRRLQIAYIFRHSIGAIISSPLTS